MNISLQTNITDVNTSRRLTYFESLFIHLYRQIFKEIEESGKEDLLDLGCGTGMFRALAEKKGFNVFGVDLSDEILRFAGRQNNEINFFLTNFEKLDFADNSMDIVTAINSLQYTNEFLPVLAEAKRVLKENGKLIIVHWGKPVWCDSFKVFNAIHNCIFQDQKAPIEFSLSDDQISEASIDKIGLTFNGTRAISCPFVFSREEAVEAFMSTVPVLAAENFISYEKLENIREITSPEYGMAYQNK